MGPLQCATSLYLTQDSFYLRSKLASKNSKDLNNSYLCKLDLFTQKNS